MDENQKDPNIVQPQVPTPPVEPVATQPVQSQATLPPAEPPVQEPVTVQPQVPTPPVEPVATQPVQPQAEVVRVPKLLSVFLILMVILGLAVGTYLFVSPFITAVNESEQGAHQIVSQPSGTELFVDPGGLYSIYLPIGYQQIESGESRALFTNKEAASGDPSTVEWVITIATDSSHVDGVQIGDEQAAVDYVNTLVGELETAYSSNATISDFTAKVGSHNSSSAYGTDAYISYSETDSGNHFNHVGQLIVDVDKRLVFADALTQASGPASTSGFMVSVINTLALE